MPERSTSRTLSRRTRRHAVRWFSGWLFIALGIVGLFLPLLQGVLFILVGMVTLGPYVPLFRKLRIRVMLRFPRLREKVVAFRHWRWQRRRERRGNKKGTA